MRVRESYTMPQSIYLLHLVLVFIIAVFILTKAVPTTNLIVFLMMFMILSVQMYFIHTSQNQKLESFDETDSIIKLKDLDLTHVRKLGELPNVTKKNINEGLDAVIASTSGKGEFSSLYESTARYKDENVRKAYKHIDYFLEKVKLYDDQLYESLVPEFSKEAYDANQDKDGA